ncbi:hypothetical protein ZYGR_0A02840 [Zygosaccharomyces rouxii]|uniref:ZYRO0A06468p n=2 Tax=Zygosaccharomyces rouxii TaxID=4956 RepID=C5DPV6_ZYGRC|nr:uncharacterized protein ZYRO0A06468g [Zygosaccharomyces rouxii]KAH9198762.1 hypothetical protein LQ764DRAFT_141044 [Zygosaccharomyces rouxii]GAV46690.1 hypothetical protein ZYGR_0A02840 [Zygosaccharomyces rouxii]CAR25717.1 ZYRO0A06468p [Zygosaccharomyces rouxii]
MLRSWNCLRPSCVRFLSDLSSRHEITESSFQRAIGFLETVDIRDIVRPNSLQATQLLKVINSVQDGHEMRKLRNRMKKQFGQNYHLIYPRLRQLSDDSLRLQMSLFRNSGRRQYDSFLKCLINILNRKDLIDTDKRQRLYDIITFQHEMYPGKNANSAMILPNEVHKWFWEHVPRQESFNHYYFLIKNDVYLSWPRYSWKFVKRMMQGSELELQLASFQLFLYQGNHQSIFHEKFHKLYSFHAMLLILHRVFKANDLRFAKVYVAVLLRSMETREPSELSFFRFNNFLLYYLSQTGDIELFFQAFSVELQFIKNVSKNGASLKILHRPLLFVLKLLRRQGYHEEFFTILSILQKVSLGQSQTFKQHAFTELITLLRSFNDCKLTSQYVMSGFDRESTGLLLNELGLWNAAFHGNAAVLDSLELQSEIDSLESLLPSSMSLKGQPSMAVMTELYRLVLSTNAKVLNVDQYRDLLMTLYSNYTRVLQERKFIHPRHDTGILNVFLYHARYELRDCKLSLALLQNFYASGLARNIRVTSNKCPFSIVVYQNNEITQAEINQLLILMHDAKIPVHFQFCTSMVLRYLQLNNQEEAHAWYQRILHAGFKVEHRLLIKAIRDNNWQYPAGFDKVLVEKLDDDDGGMVQDDAFFLEEEDSNTTTSIQDNQGHKASLQHIIGLLKTL